MSEDSKPAAKDDQEGKDKQKEEPKPPPPDREVTTEHSAKIGGRKLDYTATAGSLTLKDSDGKPKATFFYVAYDRKGVQDQGRRPITFAFNGGPGSSSAWLHLGVLGPKWIEFGDATTPPPPPYRLTDNPHSILDESDIVFIDPVGTGYSRPLEGEDRKQFHGLKEDAEWVGEFIRLITTRRKRWESPKFLIGESYGTTRAAALAARLQDAVGMEVNGIALISTILMFQTARPALGNDLPYILFLPSYAATAWYHGRLEKSVKDVRKLHDEVLDFATGDYASFLLRGSRVPEAERKRLRARLAQYTGLSEAYLEETNLRIEPQRFFKELLRERRRTVGRLDSRFLGIDRDAAGEHAEYDPLLAMVQGPFTALVNHYLRHDLRFEDDAVYEVLTEKVRPWKFPENEYAEVASNLRAAMSRNRGLRVLVASGYYDLGTPPAAAEWTVDHMGLDPELRGNVTTRRYQAGHMMYMHEPSAKALREDLGKLIRG